MAKKRKTTKRPANQSRSRLLRALLRISAVLFIALIGTFFYIDNRTGNFLAQRTNRNFPAIYSDARRISDVQAIPNTLLRQELEVRGYREVAAEPKQAGEFRFKSATLELFTRSFKASDGSQVDADLVTYSPTQGQIRNKSGERLAFFQLEPMAIASLAGGDIKASQFVPIDKIPNWVVDAVLATEDERFFSHFGIDLIGLARAMVKNVTSLRFVQGGSTLTQQLAKNLLLTPKKSIGRKILEMLAAISLERRLSKKQILEMYLNEVYLGQEGPVAIHGFSEASRNFFGKPLSEISLSEGALLAGIIKAPSFYSPRRHLKRSIERRNVVLAQMLSQDKIKKAKYERAISDSPRIVGGKSYLQRAPFFVTTLREFFAKQSGFDQAELQGLRIYTGMDLQMQSCGEKAVTNGLKAIDRKGSASSGRNKKRLEGGLLAIEPHSGKIRVWVGGRDYRTDQFDHVFQANRQIGSTVKPFLYLTALDGGLNKYKVATASSVLIDEPVTVRQSGQPSWSPENFDRRFRGDVTLRYALENSLNLPALYIAERVGIDSLVKTLKRFRIAQKLNPVPALALGAAETTVFDLTAGYAALANGGVYVKPRLYLSATDQTGVVVSKQSIEEERVADERSVFVLTNILQGVVNRGTAARARVLGLQGEAAGKTGTSDKGRDAWFMGYTPDLAAGVWVGYNDNSPIGLTGSSAAVPIWTEFMKCIAPYHENLSFIAPNGVQFMDIDSTTGELATDYCPSEQIVKEIYVEGTEPRRACHLHEGTILPSSEQEKQGPARQKRRTDGKPKKNMMERVWDDLFG